MANQPVSLCSDALPWGEIGATITGRGPSRCQTEEPTDEDASRPPWKAHAAGAVSSLTHWARPADTEPRIGIAPTDRDGQPSLIEVAVGSGSPDFERRGEFAHRLARRSEPAQLVLTIGAQFGRLGGR